MAMYYKKLLAGMLALVLALGCVVGLAPNAQAAGAFSAVGGWNESIYAEIDGIEDAAVTAVSYSGTMSGQLVGQDLEFLVRQVGTGVRIDIPGLKAGTYSLTVTAGGVSYTQSGIEVKAHDRSGYAHWNYTEGVGAYNDDGTIKANATVLYVTEENKDTVSVTAGGLTVSGIGNILNTGGKEKANGLTSKGGLANTNGGILEKLAQENRPLVVRIVGHVTKPQGVTAWGSIDYGGNADDNGGMCNMSSCKNITIEGIGNDAIVDGWGFAMNTSTGDYNKGYGKNFEFRNITFKNVPEDCIGLSGKQSGETVTDPVMHAWAHNCAFYGPKNLPDASADQDKGGGDGALDFKMGEYMTMSYCYFEAYHKTHLLGGSDTNLQYNVTWHHNYYKNCESRAPLGRQANLHIYNNLTEGQTSYCMSARANCYIYSEYNTFVNSKKVSDGNSGGKIKSFQNVFQGCTGTDAANIVIATSRDQQVSSTNKYANFDTNPAYGYLATGDYALETDTAVAKADVKANAGPMKLGTLGQEATPPVVTPTPNEGDYIHNFTENGTTSTFYTIAGNLSAKGTVNYNGLALTQCLKMENATEISFTAPTAGTLVLVFHESGYNSAVAADCNIDVDGTRYEVDADNTAAISLEAGTHTVKRGNAQIYLYYMFWQPEKAQEHQHSYTSSVTTPASCYDDGLKTFTCSCGKSYTEIIPATGHNYVEIITPATCTQEGYSSFSCTGCGDSYEDNYTPKAAHSYDGAKCTVCGAKDPDYHECSYSTTVTAPTCTSQGYTTYTCTCGDSYIDDYVDALNHSYESSVKVPTCEDDGLRIYTCTNCGESYSETIPATGHSYENGVCGVCGEKDPNYVAPDPGKQSLQKGEDGEYYYYIDGVVQESFTGLVENTAGNWYIVNGQAQMRFDGVVEVEGTKYLIKSGHVNTAYTGLIRVDGGRWLYFASGVQDTQYAGLITRAGMQGYVENGEVNFNKSGVVDDNGTLKYVKYGIWRNTFKGLARTDDGAYYYFVNGAFDSTYTGVAKLNSNWMYVENGAVSFKYSGIITVNGANYSVKYGVVQF